MVATQGTKGNGVQLDPFQTITSVNWNTGYLLYIEYNWTLTGHPDLDIRTSVPGWGVSGYAQGDGMWPFHAWSGDNTFANQIEWNIINGREIRRVNPNLKTLSISCAANWYSGGLSPRSGNIWMKFRSVRAPKDPNEASKNYVYGQPYIMSKDLYFFVSVPNPQFDNCGSVNFDMTTGKFTAA